MIFLFSNLKGLGSIFFLFVLFLLPCFHKELRISGKSLRWIDKSDLKDIGFDSKHFQEKVLPCGRACMCQCGA